MGAPMRRVSQAETRKVDMVTIFGLAASVGFAGAIGGWMWAGLVGAIAALFVNLMRHRDAELAAARQQQMTLSGFAMQGIGPEELAHFKGSADVAEKNLFDFLTAIKQSCGREWIRGSARLAADDQTEAVAPGITITLSHDLGTWYAKLSLSGDTGRKFLNGEYTQWKGRGSTPQEAIDAVIRRCGASRQQRAIQEYASRMVQDGDNP